MTLSAASSEGTQGHERRDLEGAEKGWTERAYNCDLDWIRGKRNQNLPASPAADPLRPAPTPGNQRCASRRNSVPRLARVSARAGHDWHRIAAVVRERSSGAST